MGTWWEHHQPVGNSLFFGEPPGSVDPSSYYFLEEAPVKVNLLFLNMGGFQVLGFKFLKRGGSSQWLGFKIRLAKENGYCNYKASTWKKQKI